MYKLVIRFLFLLILTNILVACQNPSGVEVDAWTWVEGYLFGWEEGDTGNFTALLSTIGNMVGGPYGWIAGIVGTAVPVYVKTRKTKKGLEGIVLATQAARATLSKDDRKVFDDAARDVMNEVKGDPRNLVRIIKTRLKRLSIKKGGAIMPSLSSKHNA